MCASIHPNRSELQGPNSVCHLRLQRYTIRTNQIRARALLATRDMKMHRFAGEATLSLGSRFAKLSCVFALAVLAVPRAVLAACPDFAATVNYAAGGNPQSVAIGDFRPGGRQPWIACTSTTVCVGAPGRQGGVICWPSAFRWSWYPSSFFRQRCGPRSSEEPPPLRNHRR